jgi:ribonuclease HII
MWARGFERVAGIDEAGRGPSAGPVFAAAVILPPDVDPAELEGVRDSKLMTDRQKDAALEKIERVALAVGIGAASVREIEQVRIVQATRLAMERALSKVKKWDCVLVDGRPIPRMLTHEVKDGRCAFITKGDQKSLSVACASVVAKVYRDRLMKKLAKRYPGYGWSRNKGYNTPEHKLALHCIGITPHHRRNDAPVREVLQSVVQAELDPPVETAVVIFPPLAIQRFARELREKHGWKVPACIPEHITLLYPFAPTTHLESALDKLRACCADLAPFLLKFDGFDAFPKVLYLKLADSRPYIRLYERLQALFPDYPLYGGQHESIIPHLTLGMFDSPEECEKAPRPHYDPVAFCVDRLHVVIGSTSGFWMTHDVIKLGGTFTKRG